MAVDKISVHVSRADQGARLDRFLAAALAPQTGRTLSRRRIRQLITAGAVYVDRKRVRIVSRPVVPGSRVDVYVEDAATSDRALASRGFVVTPQHVLYEDAHLLALDKPSGLAAQATVADAVDNLFAAARRFLTGRDGEPDPYLALLHRLDRGTSGVMLLSKSREANPGLAAAFAGQRVRKLYRAIVARPADGGPPDAWSVANQLARHRPPESKTTRMIQVDDGGQIATTEFRTLERFLAVAHVEAAPTTGRMHQIRVHLAGSGHPVLGDPLYGSRASPPAPRMMLHAMSLALVHPTSGESLCVESPLPDDFQQFLAGAGRDRSVVGSTK